MDESYAIRRYEQAAALLPLRWQQQARQLAPEQMARLTAASWPPNSHATQSKAKKPTLPQFSAPTITRISAMRSMIFKETPSLFPGIYALSCPPRAGIYKKFLPG